jgi:xylulokinase
MAGSGDGGCATLGAGSVTIGKPYCYMGSSSWVSVTSSAPLFDSSMRSFTWAHPIEGLYQPCATMQTAGSSFSWFASVFKGSADDLSLEGINRSAAESVPGAHGVVFLPYLLGERSPWWDSHAKACFVGMNMNTTWADLCRAVIEGIALNLNFSLEMMLQQVDDRTIGFIGGGAQGAIWRKIFADVFGCRVRIPTLLTEATSMGAALLGGVGVGLYSDFNIVESMNPTNVIVDHDSSLQDLYQRKSLHLRNAYQNLADLFGQMDAENA